MTSIQRIRVGLSGFSGGPGVSTFYSLDAAAMVGPLHDFYAGLALDMPVTVTVRIATIGDTIEDTTGVLSGAWATAAVAPIVGTNIANYAAPIGACVQWLTNAIADGSRVKGRTFLVPLGREAYQTDGTLGADFLTSLGTKASTLVSATTPNFVVWHRPRLARAASPGVKALAAHAGSSAAVVGSGVRDKVAVLRSRRD